MNQDTLLQLITRSLRPPPNTHWLSSHDHRLTHRRPGTDFLCRSCGRAVLRLTLERRLRVHYYSTAASRYLDYADPELLPVLQRLLDRLELQP